jgi:UDP-GlcNAc:undecaprenyl-phosphate GlcNAc-1-phosphate transferase
MVCIAGLAFFVYAYRLSYINGVSAALPATLFSVILVGMCVGFLPHNLHPARIFMGDSGALLLGLVLSVSMISLTGRVDPGVLSGAQTGYSQTETVHAMVPIYIPLLLPLSVLAIPVADLVLAVVRRTWAGKSPFAADKQHLHHRLLEIGHSHSRAVMIMYFWASLIAFATVAFSVGRTELLLVKIAMALCLLGLIVLLMPRFKPHAPRIAQRFVPPRYRREAGEPGELEEPAAEQAVESVEEPVAEPVAGAVVEAAEEVAKQASEEDELLRRLGTGSHAVTTGQSGVSGQNDR